MDSTKQRNDVEFSTRQRHKSTPRRSPQRQNRSLKRKHFFANRFVDRFTEKLAAEEVNGWGRRHSSGKRQI